MSKRRAAYLCYVGAFKSIKKHPAEMNLYGIGIEYYMMQDSVARV